MEASTRNPGAWVLGCCFYSFVFCVFSDWLFLSCCDCVGLCAVTCLYSFGLIVLAHIRSWSPIISASSSPSSCLACLRSALPSSCCRFFFALPACRLSGLFLSALSVMLRTSAHERGALAWGRFCAFLSIWPYMSPIKKYIKSER